MLSRLNILHALRQITQTITACCSGAETAAASQPRARASIQMRYYSREAGPSADNPHANVDVHTDTHVTVTRSLTALSRDLAFMKWCTVLSTSALIGVCASTMYDYIMYGKTLVLPVTVHTMPHTPRLARPSAH